MSLFRWLILAVLLSALTVSGYHRARARRHGETIGRGREGLVFQVLRAVMALALFGAVLLHVIRPDWMGWASVAVPVGVRWLGLLLGLLAVVMVQWVLRTLGPNVSETVLTKQRHELVTSGPYRWVRHPLYTTGLGLFVALGLMAGSWVVLVITGIAFVTLRWLVIPLEESALQAKFGDRYREYLRTTGRFVPRRLRRILCCAGFTTALLAACRISTAQVPGPPAPWTDPSPHQVRFVSVATGVRLEVLDWGGSGLPLVFLAGLQDVAHGFDDFGPQFTDHHKVIAITRRGYGASSRSGTGYDLATRIADLRAVLDSLPLLLPQQYTTPSTVSAHVAPVVTLIVLKRSGSAWEGGLVPSLQATRQTSTTPLNKWTTRARGQSRSARETETGSSMRLTPTGQG